MGGRVPVPVDTFSLPVEDDTLANPFALNPSKTFLDPRGAAAAATATRSLGLLAPLRAAPAAEDAGSGAAPGSPRRRAAEAERTGRRGDAEQEEARTRLSMPPGKPRCVRRWGLSLSLSPARSLARARVYRCRGARGGEAFVSFY